MKKTKYVEKKEKEQKKKPSQKKNIDNLIHIVEMILKELFDKNFKIKKDYLHVGNYRNTYNNNHRMVYLDIHVLINMWKYFDTLGKENPFNNLSPTDANETIMCLESIIPISLRRCSLENTGLANENLKRLLIAWQSVLTGTSFNIIKFVKDIRISQLNLSTQSNLMRKMIKKLNLKFSLKESLSLASKHKEIELMILLLHCAGLIIDKTSKAMIKQFIKAKKISTISSEEVLGELARLTPVTAAQSAVQPLIELILTDDQIERLAFLKIANNQGSPIYPNYLRRIISNEKDIERKANYINSILSELPVYGIKSIKVDFLEIYFKDQEIICGKLIEEPEPADFSAADNRVFKPLIDIALIYAFKKGTILQKRKRDLLFVAVKYCHAEGIKQLLQDNIRLDCWEEAFLKKVLLAAGYWECISPLIKSINDKKHRGASKLSLGTSQDVFKELTKGFPRKWNKPRLKSIKELVKCGVVFVGNGVREFEAGFMSAGEAGLSTFAKLYRVPDRQFHQFFIQYIIKDYQGWYQQIYKDMALVMSTILMNETESNSDYKMDLAVLINAGASLYESKAYGTKARSLKTGDREGPISHSLLIFLMRECFNSYTAHFAIITIVHERYKKLINQSNLFSKEELAHKKICDLIVREITQNFSKDNYSEYFSRLIKEKHFAPAKKILDNIYWRENLMDYDLNTGFEKLKSIVKEKAKQKIDLDTVSFIIVHSDRYYWDDYFERIKMQLKELVKAGFFFQLNHPTHLGNVDCENTLCPAINIIPELYAHFVAGSYSIRKVKLAKMKTCKEMVSYLKKHQKKKKASYWTLRLFKLTETDKKENMETKTKSVRKPRPSQVTSFSSS